MKIEPYLNFDGRTDEAIAFYKTAAGAKVNRLMRFKDMPGECNENKMPPHVLEKVMHADISIGDTHVLLSDGHCTNKGQFNGISLALSVANAEEAAKLFAGLSEGGKVTMPLAKTFFSPNFGMLTDKFGVAWMVVAQS